MEPQSVAHQLVGAVFNGRWRLARLIGEGGMGSVYEAQGLRGEGIRAIKVLHPEFVSEEGILNRFLAEAQAVKSLSHPNVAQIFESARAEDGTPYLVMELLQGKPLSSFMQPGKPMPPNQAGGIMLGVLQALNLAHARGIVHRDLKPDNLMLVPDGRGNQLVKVLDFGIAKVMDAAGGMGSKTKTGVLLGTPGYMSPEQIKNSKAVDPRSDLWSVGIILYELLTGREAFPADNEFTRLTLVLTQPVRPIGEVVPQLAGWTAFFQRTLSVDLNGRFQSAAEMSQALAAMLSGSGSAPGRDGGTVALNMPLSQQGPGTMQGPGAAQAPQTQQRPYAQPGPHSAQPGSHSAQPGSGHQGGGNPPPQTYNVAPSVPPPSNVPMSHAPGPATHISAQRPAGVPTLTAGSRPPSVDLIAAPPVGVPWWVVGAVAGAAFVVGFIVGYLVK